MTTNYRLNAVAICAFALLGGCSAFNPYQRSDKIDSDLRPARANPPELAGELYDALVAVNHQRLEWFDSLSSHARTSNAASLAMIAFTGWGLYEGLKPGFATDGVAGESSRKHVAKAGIATAGAYAIGNLFLNTKHDEAYVEGFKSLTCLMLRAQPYQVKQERYDMAFKPALDGLEAEIAMLDKLALRVRHVHGVDPRADATPKSASSKALSAAESALRLSRQTLDRGRQLHAEVGQSGSQLRRQADLVTAAVAEEIRRNNAGLRTPEQLLADLQSVTGRFQALLPVDRDEAEEAEAADEAPAPAPAGGAASTAPTASPSPDAAASKADLDAVRKQLAEINDTLARPRATGDSTLKALTAQARMLQSRVSQLQGDLKAAQAKLLAALPAAQEKLGAADLKELSAGMATIYTARRNVNQYLITHSGLARSLKRVPECRGGPASTMLIVPGEDKAVERGAVYRFLISGSKGLPVVSLDGNAGKLAGRERALVVGLEGGVVVADVAVGTDAPQGKLRLLVHDPATRAVEDVVLSVPKAAKAVAQK